MAVEVARAGKRVVAARVRVVAARVRAGLVF